MNMAPGSESRPRHTRTDVVNAFRRLRAQDSGVELTVERILASLGPTQTSPTTIQSTLRVLQAITQLVERGVVPGPDRVSVARLRKEFPDLSFSNDSAQEIIDALSERDTERVVEPEVAEAGRNREGGGTGPARDGLVQDLAQIMHLPQTQLVELSNVAQRHLREAVDEERQAGDKRLQAQQAAAQAQLAEERRLIELRVQSVRQDQSALVEARLAAAQAATRATVIATAAVTLLIGLGLGAWLWARLQPAPVVSEPAQIPVMPVVPVVPVMPVVPPAADPHPPTTPAPVAAPAEAPAAITPPPSPATP
ncbi:MAG TPA: hypothetical protein DCS97_12295 [Planctomycetes bacterium]|nr:hypothetical protein [Planctomycetota bacterium]